MQSHIRNEITMDTLFCFSKVSNEESCFLLDNQEVQQ